MMNPFKRNFLLLKTRLQILLDTLLGVKTAGIVIWIFPRPQFPSCRGKITFPFINPLSCYRLHIKQRPLH